MELTNYKRVASIERFGKKKYGIQVYISSENELTEDEEYNVLNDAGKILDRVTNNQWLADPENQEELRQEKESLIACFPTPIYVEQIPNGYSNSYLNPWFLVTTPKGRIKIGWRKRVINIDWSDSEVTALGKELFKGEQYTTGAYDYESVRYIHASGYEKAKEYLTKLLS